MIHEEADVVDQRRIAHDGPFACKDEKREHHDRKRAGSDELEYGACIQTMGQGPARRLALVRGSRFALKRNVFRFADEAQTATRRYRHGLA